MKKKLFATSLMFILLFSCTILFTGWAYANFTPLPTLPPHIIIQSDGKVNPSTAPLVHIGNTYTLTGDINNTIDVQCSNIMLEGNGFTITKPSVNTQNLMTPVGWLPGVHVNGANNVTLTNITFKGCITGVSVEGNSSHVIITNNTVRETLTGFVVFSSSYVNIVGNDIALVSQSFATGIHFIPSNPQESAPTHILIEANNIVGTGQEAPSLALQPSQYGIWGGFTDSKMINNNITRVKGIALYNIGADNRIIDNTFHENYQGILVNMGQDVWDNNYIYGNNFIDNCENAVVGFIRNSPVNFWDNGTVGNYWSDYAGTDKNGDGVGDSPYILETTYTDYEQNRNVTIENGRDNYPAVEPFGLSANSMQPPGVSESLTYPSGSQTATPLSEILLIATTIGFAVTVCLGFVVYYRKRHSADVSGL